MTDQSKPAGFPQRIWELLLDVADREGIKDSNGDPQAGPWEDGNGEPLQDDADAAIAWIAAAPKVEREGLTDGQPAAEQISYLDLQNHSLRQQVKALQKEAHDWSKACEKACATEKAWKDLFWQTALLLKCLPSSFVDGNEHVLRIAKEAQSARETHGIPAPAHGERREGE